MRSSGPDIQAVLFDFGDTLVQFGELDAQSLFREGARRTYRLWSRHQRRMPDFQRYYLHQWFALRWGFLKSAVLRREISAVRYIRRACRKLWLTADDAFFDRLVCEWYAPLAEAATLEPQTHKVLESLRRHGLRLGLVSNTFVPGFVLDRHLEQLGLIEYLPLRIYSCDVGYRKPDPRIFRHALSQLDLAADQVAFVGDRLDADVAGARRMHMHPIWKRPAGRRLPRFQPFNLAIIDHLAELPNALAGLSPRTLRATPSRNRHG